MVSELGVVQAGPEEACGDRSQLRTEASSGEGCPGMADRGRSGTGAGGVQPVGAAAGRSAHVHGRAGRVSARSPAGASASRTRPFFTRPASGTCPRKAPSALCPSGAGRAARCAARGCECNTRAGGGRIRRPVRPGSRSAAECAARTAPRGRRAPCGREGSAAVAFRGGLWPESGARSRSVRPGAPPAARRSQEGGLVAFQARFGAVPCRPCRGRAGCARAGWGRFAGCGADSLHAPAEGGTSRVATSPGVEAGRMEDGGGPARIMASGAGSCLCYLAGSPCGSARVRPGAGSA